MDVKSFEKIAVKIAQSLGVCSTTTPATSHQKNAVTFWYARYFYLGLSLLIPVLALLSLLALTFSHRAANSSALDSAIGSIPSHLLTVSLTMIVSWVVSKAFREKKTLEAKAAHNAEMVRIQSELTQAVAGQLGQMALYIRQSENQTIPRLSVRRSTSIWCWTDLESLSGREQAVQKIIDSAAELFRVLAKTNGVGSKGELTVTLKAVISGEEVKNMKWLDSSGHLSTPSEAHFIVTWARDTHSRHRQPNREVQRRVYKAEPNTLFNRLSSGRDEVVFLQPALNDLRFYENENRDWQDYYTAVMAAPIINRSQLGAAWGVHGFLCVDTNSERIVDKLASKDTALLLQQVAHLIASVLEHEYFLGQIKLAEPHLLSHDDNAIQESGSKQDDLSD